MFASKKEQQLRIEYKKLDEIKVRLKHSMPDIQECTESPEYAFFIFTIIWNNCYFQTEERKELRGTSTSSTMPTHPTPYEVIRAVAKANVAWVERPTKYREIQDLGYQKKHNDKLSHPWNELVWSEVAGK